MGGDHDSLGFLGGFEGDQFDWLQRRDTGKDLRAGHERGFIAIRRDFDIIFRVGLDDRLRRQTVVYIGSGKIDEVGLTALIGGKCLEDP